MRLGWALTSFAATALALGALATAATGPTQSAAEVAPLSVPIGRIGDEAVYKRTRAHVDGPSGEHLWTFRVEGVDEVMDADGNHRRAVRLDQALSIDGKAPERGFRSEFFDLSTREMPQILVEAHWAETGLVDFRRWMGPALFVWPGVWDGPDGREEWGSGDYYDPNDFWFRYQGMTLAFGDNYTSWRGPEAIRKMGHFAAERTVHSSVTVDLVGTFNGKRVLGVTEEARVLQPSVHSNAYQSTRLWFTEEHPFPVRIEWRDYLEEKFDQTTTLTLLAFRPGADRIPWLTGPNLREAPIETDQGTAWRPSEGSLQTLPISLARTQQFVESNPTLVGFSSWRNANPGSQLVGALLQRGPQEGLYDAPSFTWSLTYGTVGGATAYRTILSYPTPQSLPVHRESFAMLLVGGLRDLRIPDVVPLQPRPTLAQLDEWWHELGDPRLTSSGADFFNWGYGFVTPCGDVAATERIGCQSWDPQSLLGLVQYGTNRGLAPPSVPLLDPASFDVLEVNLTSGRITSLWSQSVHEPSVIPFSALARQPESFDPGPSNVVGIQAFDSKVFATVATTAFFGLLLVYLYPAIKIAFGRLLLVLGFTRLDLPKVLENKHRNAILEIIQSDPGINATGIAKRMPKAGWSTVVYHLMVLEKHRIIRSVVDGRHRRFFPVSASASERAAISALKNERTRAILDIVKRQPGVARGQLARAIAVSVPGVLWHLDRLIRAGLVRTAPSGRTILYYPL